MTQPKKLPRGIAMHGTRYRVRVSYEARQWSVGVYDTLGDARAALDIAKGEIARGTFVPPAIRRRKAMERQAEEERQAVTLSGWASTWLGNIEANPKRSRATVVSYESVLRNHVLPALGDVPLSELAPSMVTEWMSTLAARPSQRYPDASGNGIVKNAAIVLRSCLNAATKAGAMHPFAFPEVAAPDRVRTVEPGDEVASPAEVIAFTKEMPERLALAVPLAAWCALRMGEVLGLRRGDLEHLDDPERATLHVRRQWNSKAGTFTPPKAGSSRVLAIPSLMLEQLRDHLEQYCGDDKDALVLGTSSTALDHAWRAARDQVRPGFRFHDLRHTGLTIYAQQGATMAELLHRGGHTDVTVALRYQHATAERDRALTVRLADVVRHAK